VPKALANRRFPPESTSSMDHGMSETGPACAVSIQIEGLTGDADGEVEFRTKGRFMAARLRGFRIVTTT